MFDYDPLIAPAQARPRLSRLNRALSSALLLGLILSLAACGGRSPAPLKPQVERVELGPKGPERALQEGELSALLEDERLAPYKENTRGFCKKERYEALTEAAREALKRGAFDEATAQLKEARACEADEDQLLLLAAVKDRQLRLKANELSPEDCGALLLSWQRYLSTCHRCKEQAIAYRNMAIKRANQLGARCGAWVSWQSEPSRARLSVQGHKMGYTPAELWLPSGTELSYRAQSSDLRIEGSLSLKLGEQLSLNSQLQQAAQGEALPSYRLKAQLLCDRPSDSEPLKSCARNLRAGDRFRLSFESDAEVYLYLMSVNEQGLSVVSPTKRPAALRAGAIAYLPSLDAYQLDDQSQEDAVVVMSALKPVPRLLEGPRGAERDESWERDIKALISGAQGAQGDEVEESSDDQGWVLIKWDLRPVAKPASKETGDQS